MLRMTIARLGSILFGIAVSLALHNVAGLNYWVAFALGLLAYFIARYAIWAVQERRRLNAEMNQVLRDYRRD